MGNRRDIRAYLNEWLENWELGYYDALEDTTFIITYKNGRIKRINLQDYDGEHVSRQNIENIEYMDSCSHFDFYGDI